MSDQAFTLVPVERLDRMERLIMDLATRLDGATVTPAPEWLTVAEYAQHVGRTTRTVRNWIDCGMVETKRQGNVRLVRLNPDV